MITNIHNMIYSKSKTNYDITSHLFNKKTITNLLHGDNPGYD